ncbi:unnamed protein product, partial [Mesorhabditis belari]|uniref:Protein kinase domain-containing protein n=1 Tax=Mesorhabditis belari TaxID=2138241 RepID=A0AAF3J5M2_9BILA
MVTEHFDLMLGDFGLVREIDPAANSTLTHTGTKLYMSPEISKPIRPRPDERKFDILMKSDLYSMGLVLWEIIERRKICSVSAFDCWDKLVDDLWSDAFVLPLAECDHEIKLLIQMCVDAKYYRRPTTEEACKTIREMNDRFVSTAICFENNNRNTLIRPLGFDGTMDEVSVSDSYLSFYDIYHWNEPKYRENRIEKFIAQLDSLPRNFHELEIFSKIYQTLSPEDFLNNHLPELCKTVLRKEILQFIEAQRLFLYPYTFYTDETPSFQEFSIPGKLLQSLINETVLVSDKKIQKTVLEREWRALILYLWTQSLLMEDSFKKLHQKLATFFSGEILELEHREGTFFIEAPLPLNTYVFQLSVSPIGSKEMIYSQLTARELLDYNAAHAWFTARLTRETPKTNLPETIGFSCFYFFRTKQIKDKIFSRPKRYLLFDRPTNDQQVLCLDLSTKQLLKRYIRNEDIDEERFQLMQFDKLLEVLKKNESLENKENK